MEMEVKHVGGIESCLVSLPVHVIQTLESSRPEGVLPPHPLTLQLRSPFSSLLWHLSWSGSTSSSPSSLEISQRFADCISLPDRTTVQVRVVTDVPTATLVTVEPASEDDWDVLELNSELAEASILHQIRVVHESMRFPLWLHGRTTIMFHVVATFPKNAVVQLVPGTEVAVAPKRRKKEMNGLDGVTQSSNAGHDVPKALLRLQNSDGRLLHKSDVKGGLELVFTLTSVAFIHPETAKQFSLNSLQLVTVVPRLSSKERPNSTENNALRRRSASSPKEVGNGIVTDMNESRQAVVHLLFSSAVAKGHLMIARPLRLYLRAALHSWVYLKGCKTDLKEKNTLFFISPCQFKMFQHDTADEKNGLGMLGDHGGNKLSRTSSGPHIDAVDWSAYEKFHAALSSIAPSKGDKETMYPADKKEGGLGRLILAWFLAQLETMSSTSEMQVDSIVLGKETILHFEVKGHDFGTGGKLSANKNGHIDRKSNMIGTPLELLYVLRISDDLQNDREGTTYKLSFKDGKLNNLGGEELFAKLSIGEPVSFLSLKEKISAKGPSSLMSSLSWMGTASSDVINRMMVLLSPSSVTWFGTYDLPLPGHVLIYGPHGSGKTLLASFVAKSLEVQDDLFAHVMFVGCSRLALEKASSIQQTVSGYISEALDHAPSVVVFDDLDSIISSSSSSEGSEPSKAAFVNFLTDIMDEYGEQRKISCGIGPIAFIASVQSLDSIPQALSSSGRFDFHVQLPAPAVSERKAILKHEIQRRSLQCFDDVLLDVASKCDGYDAYDLEILVDRTLHAAIGRFLPSDSTFEKPEVPTLFRDDFSRGMHEFLPVAMRDITKPASEVGRSGWDDVGGLSEIRNAIQEMIELPSKFPNTFAQAPLRLRSNVLLYGPPGCGKTHIVGAAAAACSLRFISVKGPELLNKYIGASEQAVRDIFSKAAAAAPCLLFFDEFDSIAPKRGHDNTGVTDRVVNQFLTELDGIEVLTGVFVFAATSRPDLLDAALLRPGRLDRLLFCDFPSPKERLDILGVLSRKLPLAEDIDLDAIANITEGFSGADLQALLSDAQLEAVHEHLNNAEAGQPGKLPVITDSILKSIASKARPSISETEIQRLYGIYSQFLDSKKSTAAQSKKAKGKRATLA